VPIDAGRADSDACQTNFKREIIASPLKKPFLEKWVLRVKTTLYAVCLGLRRILAPCNAKVVILTI
jgi:hypothetical protein